MTEIYLNVKNVVTNLNPEATSSKQMLQVPERSLLKCEECGDKFESRGKLINVNVTGSSMKFV